MDVVLRLRELRRMRGLSQRDAAKLAGVGEKSISSFETGDRISSMKLSQLERLLRIYGVTLKEFFSQELDRKLAPWNVSREDEEMDAVMEDLRGLPRKQRARAVQALRRLIDASTEMPRIAKAPMPSRDELRHDWEMLTSRN